jgi:hypothetical protein
MKVMNLSVPAIALVGLIGCGTQQRQPESAQAPQPPENQIAAAKTIEASAADDAAIQAEYLKMPANVILRVQTDANGNEIAGSAQMVAVDGDVKAEQIDASYSAGKALSESKNSDGLDGDSSAQSWYGWNDFNGADYNNQTTINYSNINYGNQWGSANFNGAAGNGWAGGVNQWSNGWNNVGSPYFQTFRPLYGSQVYHGSWWRYGNPHCFRRGGFNYYWYPRPRCRGWGFC